MSFPTLVYRTPGPHHASTGTYDYRAVNSAAELEEAKAYGWFLTLQGAIDGTEEERKEPEQDSPTVLLAGYAAVVEWLSAKLAAVEITHDEGMTADELLFVICHEFALKVYAVDPVEGSPKGSPEVKEELDDNAKPTREELEAKAAELEIKFDGRTADKSLAEKIEFVLAERG